MRLKKKTRGSLQRACCAIRTQDSFYKKVSKARALKFLRSSQRGQMDLLLCPLLTEEDKRIGEVAKGRKGNACGKHEGLMGGNAEVDVVQ